jgi:PAS domain S-box-containing protein
MEADLQEYKERLEQLVEIRTSELKAAYLSLQQSEERFHKAFQSSPAPTAISTIEEGRYIDVNDSFLHVMGYSREELVGQAVHNLSVWDNVDRRGLWMKELHERGSLQGAWIHLRTKEGEIRDVLWFAEIIKVQGEDMMLSLFHDFTERRKIEQELNESREQLRALAAKLQKIREDERTKIARELHDELGQALTALKCDVAWLANKVSDDRALIDKAKDMKQNIDDTVRQIRKISTELRPGILDDLGLQAAIEWQLEEFQARSGITARFASDLNGTHIAPDVATTMFRILQETLTNVIRHAEATQVEVVIETAVSYLAMTVKDDGKGITDDEINDKKSLGILGMKERVMLLGGQLHIYGFPESGTTVNIKIPIRN